MAAKTAVAPAEIPFTVPEQAGIVLATLIIVSAVTNLPMAMVWRAVTVLVISLGAITIMLALLKGDKRASLAKYPEETILVG